MHTFIRSVEAFFNLKVSARFKFQNFNLACKSILLPPCPSHILTSAFRWIPADCADSQKSFTSCVVPFPISLSLSLLFIYFSLYLVPGDPFIFSFPPSFIPFESSEISYLHEFREIIRNSIIVLSRAILLKESIYF